MTETLSMGEVLPYRSPREREDWTAYLGMIIFLASWAVMFAALFFSYAMLRAHQPVWPPSDVPALPLLLPGINTAVIALSSAALQASIAMMRGGRVRASAWSLGLAGALGAAFLALQLRVWLEMFAQGLRPETGQYASVFYALTWFHAAHVLVGLLALAWMSARAFAGAYSPARHRPLRLWALYWHFVGVVWALMFVLVYVV